MQIFFIEIFQTNKSIYTVDMGCRVLTCSFTSSSAPCGGLHGDGQGRWSVTLTLGLLLSPCSVEMNEVCLA